ncbi:hypothetical protein [Vibrio phage phiKT1028]|nr:hypothetical protein [Vibrio phage phiKT1028]
MPKNSKHKQAKRKARQRNIKAAKVRARLKEAQDQQTAHGEHAMSDSMKVDAKSTMWKVFSQLPPQLQEQALEDFKKGGDQSLTEFDFEGIGDLIGEALNRYMGPHATMEVIEWLEDGAEVCMPDELRPKVEALDKSIVTFITNSTVLLERFEKIKAIENAEERNDVLFNDEEIANRLTPTLLSFQQDAEDLIDPIMDFAEAHADLIDERVKEYGAEHRIDNVQEVTRHIHLRRLNKYFDHERMKNAAAEF